MYVCYVLLLYVRIISTLMCCIYSDYIRNNLYAILDVLFYLVQHDDGFFECQNAIFFFLHNCFLSPRFSSMFSTFIEI